MSHSTSRDDKLKLVQHQAAQVTALASENIKVAIKNTEKLDDIELKSRDLEANSNVFNTSARRVRRMMCVRSWKMLGLVMLAIVILLLIIIVPIVVTLRK